MFHRVAIFDLIIVKFRQFLSIKVDICCQRTRQQVQLTKIENRMFGWCTMVEQLPSNCVSRLSIYMRDVFIFLTIAL